LFELQRRAKRKIKTRIELIVGLIKPYFIIIILLTNRFFFLQFISIRCLFDLLRFIYSLLNIAFVFVSFTIV